MRTRPLPRRSVHALRLAAPLVVAIATASCGARTSTTHLWQANDVGSAPMRHVIVFAGGMSEPERRSLEEAFVTSLGERNVTATPSYRVFPVLPDTNHARAAVQKGQFEGALVATVRRVDERQTYVPGHYYGGGFWSGYYGPGWGMSYSPGYVVTDEIVDVETSLWDLRTGDGQLVWSALTTTTNPSSTRDFQKSLTREVVPQIARTGALPKDH